jgi:indole-3-glycerol phosphate synthase
MKIDLAGVPGTLGEIARRCQAGVSLEVPVLSSTVPPSFSAALAGPGLSLIAEVKRKSPSQGEIALALDPAEVARQYALGGAAAISVLTEPHYFMGSDQDLLEVKKAVQLPVLRKDFMVHPVQLAQSQALGASAVLLIVAVLGLHTKAFLQEAQQLGLDALIEVHDELELAIALEALMQVGSGIIGINNRNLVDLSIDLSMAPKLAVQARHMGYNGLLVAESGYDSPNQLQELQGLCDAVLIGTSLARSGAWRQAAAQMIPR